jgi:hypothetical protein
MAKQTSTTAKSVASTSSAKQTPGYVVTVRGQYWAMDDRKKTIKTYGPESFFLPEKQNIRVGYEYKMIEIEGAKIKRSMPKFQEVNSLAYALHIIQRYLLPARLASKHPDCVRFRTCVITNTRRSTPKDTELVAVSESNVKEMSLEQLRVLANLKGLAIPLDGFASVHDARQAVQDELDNMRLAIKEQDHETDLSEESTAQDEERETEDYENGQIETSKVSPEESDLFA